MPAVSHCSQHCVPCLRRKFAEFWDLTGGESVTHGIPWAFGGRTGGQSDQRNLFIPTQPMWWYNTIINHNKPPSWEWFIPPISGDDWGMVYGCFTHIIEFVFKICFHFLTAMNHESCPLTWLCQQPRDALWASYHDPSKASQGHPFHPPVFIMFRKIAISGVSGHTPSQAHFFFKSVVLKWFVPRWCSRALWKDMSGNRNMSNSDRQLLLYSDHWGVSRCSEAISEAQYLSA